MSERLDALAVAINCVNLSRPEMEAANLIARAVHASACVTEEANALAREVRDAGLANVEEMKRVHSTLIPLASAIQDADNRLDVLERAIETLQTGSRTLGESVRTLAAAMAKRTA